MDIYGVLAKSDIDDKLKQEILSCFENIVNENIEYKAVILSSRLYFPNEVLKTIEGKHLFVRCKNKKEYETITDICIRYKLRPIDLIHKGLLFF